MMIYIYCRGPEAPIGKWADHLRMDGDQVIATQETGVLEVPSNTIQGPPAIAIQGALDVVGLGARRNEERIITRSGVDMARKNRNGFYPRKLIIVVSTVPSYIHMGLCNWV